MNLPNDITFDDRDFGSDRYSRHEQHARPQVFVKKLRQRRGTHVALGFRDNPSRLIGVDEFASAYAAAEFAAHFGLHLDTHVTIDFCRLGISDPDKVQASLSQFTRCYAAWCAERLIPPAWIASVEMSQTYEYHVHIALFVPGDLGDVPMTFRSSFRRWARAYTDRRGEHVPRAIKVRGGRKASLMVHWLVFHYLMKGFDRGAVLCAARNSPDGRAILLGDIIARHFHDPGPVSLNRRISISNSLGPKRREFGAPTGCDFMLPHGPNWSVFNMNRTEPLTVHEELTTRWQIPIPTPFRSTFEDGVYDVRQLYSPCFYNHVARPLTKLHSWDVTTEQAP